MRFITNENISFFVSQYIRIHSSFSGNRHSVYSRGYFYNYPEGFPGPAVRRVRGNHFYRLEEKIKDDQGASAAKPGWLSSSHIYALYAAALHTACRAVRIEKTEVQK
jgi:hypothetical protein